MEMHYCVTSYFEDKTEPFLDIQCTRTIDFTKKTHQCGASHCKDISGI